GDGIAEGDCDCDGNVLDECGVCGGDGIAEGDCDCDGNVLDECGVCGGEGILEGSCGCDGTFPDFAYDCDGNCLSDEDGDGTCDEFESPGCTDATAGNYDSEATFDDGSCTYGGCLISIACNYDASWDYLVASDCDFTSCVGCTDAAGCNYEADNTVDNGSCTYAAEGVDCDGICLADADGDGICDPFEVEGCQDATACNYSSDATDDDASCFYTQAGYDCDGICLVDSDGDEVCDEFEVEGCSDADACNYLAAATDDDGSCILAAEAYDCDGNCLTDSDGDGVCNELEIYGCTDMDSDSFMAEATEEDGSCIYLGCTIQGACNFDAEANSNNGSCDFASCSGCMDESACNYDATLIYSVNSACDYAEDGLDCEGNCLNDSDGDGVCDENEIEGCLDPTACNFNADSTDEIACDFGCYGCTVAQACNYDPMATMMDSCDYTSCVGCGNPAACNYDSDVTVPSNALCEFAPSPFENCDGSCVNDSDEDDVCDEFEILGCTDPDLSGYNEYATDDDGSCEVGGCTINSPSFQCNYDEDADYLILSMCFNPPCTGGNMTGTPTPLGVLAPGCMDLYACNYDPAATEDDGSCEYWSCIGCTNEEACNYDEGAIYNDGSCEYTSCAVLGCTNVNACNYNAEATQEDGTCEYTSCLGCTDENAANYDPTATVDNNSCSYPGCVFPAACNYDLTANTSDGSCEYTSCADCMDDAACTYDPTATISDNSACDYANDFYDCDGACLSDSDEDGVCDELEVAGCTDEAASNYDADATDEDGSCNYPVPGCIQPAACNYNPAATVSDDSCEYTSCVGCMDEMACTYDPEAIYNDQTECSFAEAYYNCDGSCISDADGDGYCDEMDNCSDLSACNYDDASNGECLALDACGVCGGAGVDTDGDGTCDSEEVFGCTDAAGCNYDGGNTEEDGSCDYCSCPEQSGNYDGYSVIVEPYVAHTSGALAGLTTYRLYLQTVNATDVVTSITGNDEFALSLNTTTTFYQHAAGGADVTLLSPSVLEFFPDAIYDSYVTMNLEGPSASDEDLTLLPGVWSDAFEAGDNFTINDNIGSGWYVFPGGVNANVDENNRMFFAQLTTSGIISGSLRAQVFPEGDNFNDHRLDMTFAQSPCGCTDASACNFNEGADYDDGSCYYDTGATDCFGVCYDDADGDGVCDENEVDGCTDAIACNYNDSATEEDESCTYPSADNLDCDGNCLADADGDGICDDEEAAGCMDATACNYDAAATDDDASCFFPISNAYDCDGNCFVDSDGDGVCNQNEILGCTDAIACNYDADATEENGTCEYASCSGCQDAVACNYDATSTIDVPESCVYVVDGYDCSGVCLVDTDGDGVCDAFEVAGCTDATACNYDAGNSEEDGSCDYCSCGDPMTNYTMTMEEYAVDGIEGMTTYRFYVNMENATDFLSAMYGTGADPLAMITSDGFYNDAFASGSTADGVSEIFFATFPSMEFDSWVTIGIDAAPEGAEVSIGTVESGNQPWIGAFNASSEMSGSNVIINSEYGGAWYVTNGSPNGLPDAENQRVLFMQVTTAGSLSGTMNAQIFAEGDGNFEVFKSFAFDGPGTYDAMGESENGLGNACGCTDSEADNYDSGATYDDGNCIFYGCIDDSSCNYDAGANTDDDSCWYADAGYDCDGVCLSDIDGDGICDEFEIAGCQDAGACNYDMEATDEDGSCWYATSGYDCDGICLNDADGDAVCDEFEISGCMEVEACNYNLEATDEDGSCWFAEILYDCDGVCLNDVDGDGLCDELEVAGCQEADACNYLPTATDDDGSCDYCSCQSNTTSMEGYGVIIDPIMEHTSGELAGLTTYRVYLTTPNAADIVTAFIGDEDFALNLSSSTDFYQHSAGGVTPEGLSDLFVSVMPELAYDSYVTIGLDGPAMLDGESNAGIIPGPWSDDFENGGPVNIDDALGGGWYVVPSAPNAL
ncbi:MAG: hypothetical protein ACKVJH_09570, partial [Flavobacteriales bacterium]